MNEKQIRGVEYYMVRPDLGRGGIESETKKCLKYWKERLKNEKIKTLKMVLKDIYENNKYLRKEPCCAWNIKDEKYFCYYHGLMTRLEKELRKSD